MESEIVLGYEEGRKDSCLIHSSGKLLKDPKEVGNTGEQWAVSPRGLQERGRDEEIAP